MDIKNCMKIFCNILSSSLKADNDDGCQILFTACHHTLDYCCTSINCCLILTRTLYWQNLVFIHFEPSWAWCDWPLLWLTHRPSVLWHCWLGHLTHKIVCKMTCNVSSGTLNPTIPYHFTDLHWRWKCTKRQVSRGWKYEKQKWHHYLSLWKSSYGNGKIRDL